MHDKGSLGCPFHWLHGMIARVNATPSPALVTQRAVQRLPRLALLLFCAAYVLPGLFGRDPWRNADQTAFGYMLAIAEGRTGWLAPTIGGLPPENAVLPHWLGAASIWLLSPLIDAPMAARVPFGLLLAGVLVLTWYTTFQLARTEAAQPVAFAFGGEADAGRLRARDGRRRAAGPDRLARPAAARPRDHARAGAAVRRGAWCCGPAPPRRSAAGARASRCWSALPLLAASGAPTMATLFGVAVGVITARSTYARRPRLRAVGGAGHGAGRVAGAGRWAPGPGASASRPAQRRGCNCCACGCGSSGRSGCWRCGRSGAGGSTWPSATSRCRLALAAVSLLACIAGGGFDRALMLGLPAFAVLAAFALPTLQRGTTCGDRLVLGVLLQHCRARDLGHLRRDGHRHAGPHRGQRRQARTRVCDAVLAWLPFALAVAGTLAWLALVRWRTGRHQHALWKSLVLPAGGVALAWLLLMTLWLPLLDYARSNRPWVAQLAPHVPAGACVAAPGYPRSAVAALEQYGRWRVEAGSAVQRPAARCMLRQERRGQPAADGACGWEVVARVRRPTDRDEATAGPAPLTLTQRSARASWPRCAAATRTRAAGNTSLKLEPLPGSLCDVEFAAVALHHVLDDRQAQAGAAGVARAAAVDAVEALGQARQVLARDADAVVAHLELGAAVAVAHAPGDRRSRPPSGV